MRQRSTRDAQVTRCSTARTRLLRGEPHRCDTRAMLAIALWRLLRRMRFCTRRRRGNHRLGNDWLGD
jgi:hypothetical protein